MKTKTTLGSKIILLSIIASALNGCSNSNLQDYDKLKNEYFNAKKMLHNKVDLDTFDKIWDLDQGKIRTRQWFTDEDIFSAIVEELESKREPYHWLKRGINRDKLHSRIFSLFCLQSQVCQAKNPAEGRAFSKKYNVLVKYYISCALNQTIIEFDDWIEKEGCWEEAEIRLYAKKKKEALLELLDQLRSGVDPCDVLLDSLKLSQ